MPTLLEQLRTMTTVVADTGDINSIQAFKPTDSTTNPSLLAAAAEKPKYQPIEAATVSSYPAPAGATNMHGRCAEVEPLSLDPACNLTFPTLALVIEKRHLGAVLQPAGIPQQRLGDRLAPECLQGSGGVIIFVLQCDPDRAGHAQQLSTAEPHWFPGQLISTASKDPVDAKLRWTSASHQTGALGQISR